MAIQPGTRLMNWDFSARRSTRSGSSPESCWKIKESLNIDRAVFTGYLARRRVEIERYRAPQANRKNVIFIQYESLDDFCVDTRYQGKEIMPFFNSIKQEGLYFSNTLDTTGGGRTSDAEFLVLTSVPPLPDKPVFINYDLRKIPSLPRRLLQEGYFTFSIHGFNGSFWNRELAHRALGFEKSFFLEDLDQEDLIGWGISGSVHSRPGLAKDRSIQPPRFRSHCAPDQPSPVPSRRVEIRLAKRKYP